VRFASARSNQRRDQSLPVTRQIGRVVVVLDVSLQN
jgi:hypothetical protein